MSNGAARELFRKFKEGLSKVHDKGVQGWKSLVEERINCAQYLEKTAGSQFKIFIGDYLGNKKQCQ